MRRLMTLTLTLAAIIALAPGLNPAWAQPPPPAATSEPSTNRLLTAGAGAIVGVVAFNMLTYPLGPVPFVSGTLAAPPALDIALGSRLLAVLTGGTGALLAHYAYPLLEPEAPPIDPVYPLVLAAGALAGVAAVNVMTYGLGTLPLAVGTEASAPVISSAAAAASRIFVIASGVMGAWIADAFYTDGGTPAPHP